MTKRPKLHRPQKKKPNLQKQISADPAEGALTLEEYWRLRRAEEAREREEGRIQ